MKVHELKKALEDISGEKKVNLLLSGVEERLEGECFIIGPELSTGLTTSDSINEFTIQFDARDQYNKDMFLCDYESTSESAQDKVEAFEKAEELHKDEIENIEYDLETADKVNEDLLTVNEDLLEEISELKEEIENLKKELL